MTTEIAISRIHFPVTRLGPGRRVGIWVQGCSIRCPGCISVDTWVRGRGRADVSEVLEAIAPWMSTAEGFTISGGEPFDQPDALASLLAGIQD
jgi:anaerobic ribonucleoside-triphosphate reductase activating protein